MEKKEILWEPMWDFSQPFDPPIPASLPYSLDDPKYLGFLKNNFRFGIQLCFRIYDTENKKVLWRDLATAGVILQPRSAMNFVLE